MPTPIPVENAERSNVTIKGVQVTVAEPFTEGHVLRANEASVLNQTFQENVRNNLASAFAKALQEHEKNGTPLPDFQKLTDEYVAAYDFGVRRGGGGLPADPVEREAYKLAEGKVKEALKKRGHKLSEIPAETLKAHVEKALEKYPEIRKAAAKVVKARQEATKTEELDLGE